MAHEEAEAILDAQRMRILFNEIGKRFAARGQVAEIAVFGGSALILMFDFRESTRDIDYVQIKGGMREMATIAEDIGNREGLPQGWFNDAVRIFVSDRPDYRLLGDFPAANPGLRVFTASPRYVLAMKIDSMRSSLETNDIKDIWNLIDICEIADTEQARGVYREFFPDKPLPKRNDLILEDIFEAKLGGRPYSRAIGY